MSIAVFILGFSFLFLANLAFYLAGGYFMLFRTALNDRLGARSKLSWMWLQTVLPVTALGYAVFVEKNKTVKLAVGLCLLLCSLAVGYGATKMPWQKMAQRTDAFATQIRNVAALKAQAPSVKLDAKNPIALKAQKTMDRLKTMQASETDDARKKLDLQALVVIGMIGTVAVQNSNSGDPAKAAQNPKIEQAIDDMNTRLDNGALTEDAFKEWVASVKQALAKSQ